MQKTRLDDMLDRYGEVCNQKTAGKILNVVPRTIARMMLEGRLRRVDRGVDVRSIYEYIENPRQMDLEARAKVASKKAATNKIDTNEVDTENIVTQKVATKAILTEGAFLAAARAGRWAPRR